MFYIEFAVCKDLGTNHYILKALPDDEAFEDDV